MKKYVFLFAIIVLLIGCSKGVEKAPVIEPEPIIMEETCDDGIKNQGEMNVDCGGPCSACPSCDDLIKNQGEAGIDCGGPCPPCETCNDIIKNQGEVDIDCGGPCPPCEIAYEVRTEDANALREKMKLSTKAEFLTNSYPAGLELGETHIFVLGIVNVLTEAKKFKLELDFKEARDARTNLIETDKETMMGWVEKNVYEDYTLVPYAQIPLPIGVTVGDEIAPGVATVPGTYYYNVNIFAERSERYDEDYIDLEFSFRVE